MATVVGLDRRDDAAERIDGHDSRMRTCSPYRIDAVNCRSDNRDFDVVASSRKMRSKQADFTGRPRKIGRFINGREVTSVFRFGGNALRHLIAILRKTPRKFLGHEVQRMWIAEMEKIINGGEARLATRTNQSVERGPIKAAARIHQRPADAFSHGIDFIFHEACIVFIEKTIMLRKRNTVEPVTVLVVTNA